MADSGRLAKSQNNGFPSIMGILNVTPDSFFEDSRVNSIENALLRTEEMIGDGAEWLDIGGESTRPGAIPVDPDEELERVIPIIKAIRNKFPEIGLSIDTRRASVAKDAVDAGVDMVNDVSGLSDPEMSEVVIKNNLSICIMHMQGLPNNMQNNPNYNDVVSEVRKFLTDATNSLLENGLPSEKIIVDPGIGFGKTLQHNIALLSSGRRIVPEENMNLMWGVSRKTMFEHLLSRERVEDRLSGTLGIAAMAPDKGVDIIRVHDVREHVDLYTAMRAIE